MGNVALMACNRIEFGEGKKPIFAGNIFTISEEEAENLISSQSAVLEGSESARQLAHNLNVRDKATKSSHVSYTSETSLTPVSVETALDEFKKHLKPDDLTDLEPETAQGSRRRLTEEQLEEREDAKKDAMKLEEKEARKEQKAKKENAKK